MNTDFAPLLTARSTSLPAASISHSFNGNTVQLLAQLNSVEVGGASKGGVVAISTVQVAKQKIVSF